MLNRARFFRLTLPLTMLLPCLLLILCGGSTAASPVAVFPIPGSQVASPRAQIAFRGVPASQLGTVTVTGSRSGAHSGSIESDSDGQGASFLPDKPFDAGESVTVSTSLDILGASKGTFRFTVASPAPGYPPTHWPPAYRNANDVWRFHSRPDLVPAASTITKRGATAPGDIFLSPQFGPLQDGPMILDASGNLIWFKRLNGNDSAADFRVQRYQGRPVLTWWQGYVTGGIGVGEGVINDSSYRQIMTVNAANGLHADLHEFTITPQGTALLTAEYPVYWNASSIHGSRRQIVDDSVVQEIDIATGLLLYQWDSLDHIPVSSSYQALPRNSAFAYDYFHVNSVSLDPDGTLLVSGRNTSAAYKVDHRSGHVIWTLGGRHSSFRMRSGSTFALQHDVRIRSAHDWFVTVFDDGDGPPRTNGQSRGLKLFLDVKHMTAARVAEFDHAPPLLSGFEGNYQQLQGGDQFFGWGQQPYFSEFNSRGQMVFDGHFIDGEASYRAYRFMWSGAPQTLPSVAVSGNGRTMSVYASWNGATNVASWRVLAGSSAGALRAVATAAKRGFETGITVGTQSYVAVQALDSHGHTLATSPTVRG
jgi:hypothetical protein